MQVGVGYAFMEMLRGWGRLVVFGLVCGLLDGRNQYKQKIVKKYDK